MRVEGLGLRFVKRFPLRGLCHLAGIDFLEDEYCGYVSIEMLV